MLLMINLYTFINTILIYSIADYIIKPDKRTKWEVFLNAAPIGKNKIVGEKYIFDYIFVGIGIFTSFVLIAGVNININRNFTFNEYLGVIYAILLILLNSAIHKPLTYLLNEKGAGVFSAIFITGIFAIGIISILMEKVEWLIGVGKKMDGIFNFLKSRNIIIVLCIVIIFHFLSYLFSIKLYNTKRD